MTHRPSAFYLLLVVILFLLLAINLSSLILPPITSPCGRLVHVKTDGAALTQNNARLEIPEGSSWQEMEFSYDIAHGEALDFVIDREGDDFSVLRISRASVLASALLLFSDGIVREKRPLQAIDPAGLEHGKLRVSRRESGWIASIGDKVVADLSSADHQRGDLELAMFPPSNSHLFERVSLDRVTLAGGAELPPVANSKVFRSIWFPLVIAPLLGIPLLRLTGPSLERFFPYHSSHSKKQILVFLVSVIVGLCILITILKLVYRDNFTVKTRVNFRVMGAILILWSFGFMRLRDRLLRRHPRLRANPLFQTSFLPAGYLLGSVLAFLLFFLLIAFFNLSRPEVPTPGDTGTSRLKVLCYGGSSTAGYPFPKEWPFTYPSVLQAALRQRCDPEATVLNLGVHGASITLIDRNFEFFLRQLHPSHVVIYSNSNNLHLTLDEFRQLLEHIIDRGKPRLEGMLLVKEQNFDVVYDDRTGDKILGHYAVTDEVGKERGIPVIDPLPQFRAHRDEYLFANQKCHLTKFGHALLARMIEEALLSASPRPACGEPVQEGTPPAPPPSP